MTMGTTSSKQGSVQNTDISQSPSPVNVGIHAATPQSIRAILLADGWHDVENCQLVQFALGEAHSPITPTKLYPYLTYSDSGRQVYTPMSQILGFDLTGSDS